jgi:hypothetical protein
MAYRKFFRTLLDERPDADPGGVVVGPRSHHDLARFREHVVTPATYAHKCRNHNFEKTAF